MELFLNSTAGGSNGGYGGQMMGGMGKSFFSPVRSVGPYYGIDSVELK